MIKRSMSENQEEKPLTELIEEDIRWIAENMDRLREQHRGHKNHISVYNKEVIGQGTNSQEAIQEGLKFVNEKYGEGNAKYDPISVSLNDG